MVLTKCLQILEKTAKETKYSIKLPKVSKNIKKCDRYIEYLTSVVCKAHNAFIVIEQFLCFSYKIKKKLLWKMRTNVSSSYTICKHVNEIRVYCINKAVSCYRHRNLNILMQIPDYIFV